METKSSSRMLLSHILLLEPNESQFVRLNTLYRPEKILLKACKVVSKSIKTEFSVVFFIFIFFILNANEN